MGLLPAWLARSAGPCMAFLALLIRWMTARGAALLDHDLRLPAPDLFLVADLMRWAALGLVALAAARLTGAGFRRLARRIPTLVEPEPAPEHTP